MKRISVFLLTLFAVIASVQTLMAQDSGVWIGGKVGYWHTDRGDVNSNSFTIAPEVGYDFNSKWSVAGTLGFDYTSVDSRNSNVVVIEPYARYKYFNKGAVSLFVDGGLGFAMGDSDGFKIGFTPGIAYKVSDRFSLLAAFGFLGYKNHYYNGGGDGIGFSLKSSDLRFGVYYSF